MVILAMPGAGNGTVAAVFSGTWGPLNQLQTIEQDQNYALIYGNETEIIDLIAKGGASKSTGCSGWNRWCKR